MNLLQIHEPGQTPLPHEDVAAVGIDLGTTHSVVAIAADGNAEVVHNIHGHALVPSVVYYGKDGSIEVGYPAKARLERGERGTIASIKRLMGKGAEDIQSLMGNLPYELAAGTQGMIRLHANGREVTPVEISADILKELKHIATRALGKDVTKAVITVPAYFDDAARNATKDAAKLAGLEVLRLVNEPTAAALAYGLEKGVEGVYAIYDLGGGTFDISLLKLEAGVFQVLSTAGNTTLGGDDFDQAIAAWVLTEMKFGAVHLPSEEVGALVSLAREAKHRLSSEKITSITYKEHSVQLTRDDMDMLIRPYVDKTLEVCEQALSDAGLSTVDVKGIVMVGGSTRVPLVYDCVKNFFSKAPLTDVNPDEVVAIGASLQAAMLTGQAGEHNDSLLLDVIPLSLGLETMGGLTEKLLYRNTPIPTSVSQEFTTYKDGQSGMQIHVVQGEREMVVDNRSLAQFELTGIPPLPAGIARIKITFSVDADGLLTVSARESTTGVEQIVRVKPSYGLPPEEIERMLIESMAHAKGDITERLLTESRVEAQRSIAELESAINQDGDLLNEVEKRQINQQIITLKNAADGDDRDYIDAELQELGRIAQPFAEKRMDRAIGFALKGAHVDKIS